MQIKFDANKKRLDTTPAFGLLVQGENLAESIQITGPKMVGALDLSQLRVAVRMTSQQYETTVEKTLEQTTDGDTITFTWQVDKQFTSSPGKVDVMLVGYGGNEEVIKITSSGMVVQEDKTFGAAPPESTWEQILQQMQDFATQAYESKTAAENSAAAAAESQRVTEEKAAQATEAASTAAAQAAAKTEQQIRQYADDRYARPLVTKTGPAASLEVYPDKLSNLKVYALGFTQQAGSGEPSPSNVRQLTNGGLRMYKLVIDGSQSVAKETSVRGTVYYKVNVTCPANVYGASSVGYSKQYCNRAQIKNADGQTQGDYAWVYGENRCRIAFFSKPWITTAEAMQAELAADPLIIWYIPEDESQATGLYAPIVLQGGEYRATCLPLTAPLCEGDSVVSWAKSGCDQQLTLDGSALTVAASGSNYTVVAANAVAGGTVYASGLAGLSLTAGSIAIPGTAFPSSVTNASQANTWLQSNPQTLYYQSTAYTEADDIAVSLETHVRSVFEFNQSTWLYAIASGKFQFGANNLMVLGQNAKASYYSGLSCEAYKPFYAGSWSALGDFQIARLEKQNRVYDSRFETVEEFKQWLSDNPVKLEYELATPITYAHPAVELPALPDNTGKVTITGQSGGTVTVVFNKSIIKEIAEIKAAMMAMGANLSM